MKILLLTRYDRMGASSRVRTLQYLPYLQLYGHEVVVRPCLPDTYLRSVYESASNYKLIAVLIYALVRRLLTIFRISQYDLVWIEKEFIPFFPALPEKIISLYRIPYIVDLDDAIFHRYDLNNNKVIRLLLSRKIDSVMKRATVVIAGNDYIANRARSAGAKRVEILPSVVDINKYTYSNRFNKEIFNIGWIGSPSTSKYLEIIREPLAEICKDAKTAVTIVGGRMVSLPGVNVIHKIWSEDNEVEYIKEFDVGIMPLPQGEWERGKCGYKLIQYMACGRPVIGSTIGINKQIINHGYNGFLADEKKDWLLAFEMLRDSMDLRRVMGSRGRALIEEKYCLDVTAKRLRNIIESI